MSVIRGAVVLDHETLMVCFSYGAHLLNSSVMQTSAIYLIEFA